MKIYLSPSLQENNVGVGAYGTEEKRMNQLADILQPLLIKYGYQVFRNTPTMTLAEAVKDSNNKAPDLHLALHSNAGGGRGCEIYCHKYGGNGEKYARAIYKYLEPLTPSADRGVKESYKLYNGKPMYEPAYTTAPAVLIEVAFHDNATDAEFIINNLQPIATAILNGVNEVAGVDPIVELIDYKQKYNDLVKEIQTLILKYEQGGR